MRKNYLMKSVSIILMLLAMMFSCQPVTEDISSSNSNSNNTNQGGNTAGDNTGGNTDGGNENTGNENNNGNQNGENTEENDKVLTVGGTGVYNYSLYFDDIVGDENYPTFSVLLLTDNQLEKLSEPSYDYDTTVTEADFLNASKEKPIYQICSYGDMMVSTLNSGDYAVWGEIPVNNKFQYYNGIAASIKGNALSVTVDMTKIANVELKSYLDRETTFITDKDTIILNGYKPYILGLGSNYNWIMYMDALRNGNGDMCKMDVGAVFPTSLKKDAPAIPTCYDLTYFYSSFLQNYFVELKDNSVSFIAGSTEHLFCFTNVNMTSETALKLPYMIWFNVGGAEINALNKEVALDGTGELGQFGPNMSICQIKPGVLTAGNMYIATLIVKGAHEAYVKVSEVKPTAIKINSTNHKTSYYMGDDINVTNLTVEATGSDGKKYTVNVTPDMISGFDSSELGTQTLMITLNDCEATYNVEVKDVVVNEINVTAIEAADKMKDFIVGEYYLVNVSGEMTDEIMGDIQDTIYDWGYEEYPRIVLDLSNTTGLTSIYYFHGACLTGLILPSGVTEISGFEKCYNLTSITIPNGTTQLGSFYRCNSLTSLTIPASLTSIGSFDGCSHLTKFEIDENNKNFSSSTDGKILYNKDKTVLIAYPSASGDITISDGVTKIGWDAFADCDNLISVVIPDSVTKIDEGAFGFCSNLESVTIGKGLSNVDGSAFDYCSNLTSINVDASNENYSSSTDGKMLLNKDKTVLIAYPSVSAEVTLPDGLVKIGDNAFYNCRNFTSITLPDSVVSIGEDAFNCCTVLTSITIGTGVTSIANEAFSNCNSLTTVNYRGTKEQWRKVNIGSSNGKLTEAIINYNYTGE